MRLVKWVAVSGLLAVAVCLTVALTYCTIPDHNCEKEHFDTLIVLGCPPDPDGTPSSEERERVREAVEAYRAGRADHLIVTGGSPHSRVAEADVMAHLAVEAGVPAKDVVIEPQAQNTIENIFYSNQILRARGWKSAEVVSSPSHLPRTALILQHYPFCWRTQASRWPPEYSRLRIGRYYLHEVAGTVLLRWFGFRRSAHLTAGPAGGRTLFDRRAGVPSLGLSL